MFVHQLTVQLHHTDAYSILFFANQFVFCHDAFQAYLTSMGYPLAHHRGEAEFVAVVVHAESDYKAPVQLGDQIRIEYRIAEIGKTHFTNSYTFKNQDGVTVGTAKIVQVTLDPKTGKKINVPKKIRDLLVRNQ